MPTPDLPPLFEDLTFLSPMSEARAADLVRFLIDGRPRSVLDIGCGWGELLLRTLTALPAATGLGVDLEPQRIDEARRRARTGGLAERATFEARDARTATLPVDAVVCIGSSHVWGPPVEAAKPLDYAAALTALRALLPPGGRLVYGEAIWASTPTPAATAALGGGSEDYLPTETLVDLAAAHGFTVTGVDAAGLDEWDAFESGFVRRLERWLEAHPATDPDAHAVRDQLDGQRSRYLDGYRGVYGMAYLTLVADCPSHSPRSPALAR